MSKPVPKLASNRSPYWAFMQKFEVPDYDHPERNYLTRWRLIQTPWFGIYVHKLEGPDPRATLHDHPWSFVSFILKGGYHEHRLNPVTREVEERDVGFCNIMRRDDAHFIEYLHRGPTWSLLFVGKRRRTWGYLEPFIDGDPSWCWTAFNEHHYDEAFQNALAQRKAQ